MEICDNMKKLQYGLTEIRENESTLKISHGGNMGNTIESTVNPNLKKLGYASIKYLKRLYRKYKETASPDYSYLIIFDKNLPCEK